jgi:hypothetical protein
MKPLPSNLSEKELDIVRKSFQSHLNRYNTIGIIVCPTYCKKGRIPKTVKAFLKAYPQASIIQNELEYDGSVLKAIYYQNNHWITIGALGSIRVEIIALYDKVSHIIIATFPPKYTAMEIGDNLRFNITITD